MSYFHLDKPLKASVAKFFLTLLFCSSLLAFAAKSENAPLAGEIQAAKTVYLVNESGMAIVADYAYRELKKWNRFEVVDSPEKADLILVFTAVDEDTTSKGIANGKPIVLRGSTCHASIDIRSGKIRDRSLWQDTKNCSRHGASADLILELKKRMAE